MIDRERRAARGPNLASNQRTAAEASNRPPTLKKGLMCPSLRGLFTRVRLRTLYGAIHTLPQGRLVAVFATTGAIHGSHHG